MTRRCWRGTIGGGVVALLVGVAPLCAQVLPPPATDLTTTVPSPPPSPWSLVLGACLVLGGLAGGVAWYRRMRRVVASKVQAEAISARRREEAEEALRATERRMQQLVHSVKAIVWRMDAVTQRFTFVSQEAEQLLGYPVSHWTEDPGFYAGDAAHRRP